MNSKKYFLYSCLSFLFLQNCFADSALDANFRYHFYAGLMGGYGTTTWSGLVPPKDKQGAAIDLSAPVKATEGGAVWGYFLGYEFFPYFALEAYYERFPNAKIDFDEFSLFSFEHNGRTSLNTHTETASLMAKLMVIIPHTNNMRAFSSFGAAGVHRYDSLFDNWRISPTFAAGFNYNITPHFMIEVGANYIAGFGQSELDPVQDYVPFLYSGFARLAYRF